MFRKNFNYVFIVVSVIIFSCVIYYAFAVRSDSEQDLLVLRGIMESHNYKSMEITDISDRVCNLYDAATLRKISEDTPMLKHSYFPNGGIYEDIGAEFWEMEYNAWMFYRVIMFIEINRIDGKCSAIVRSIDMGM